MLFFSPFLLNFIHYVAYTKQCIFLIILRVEHIIRETVKYKNLFLPHKINYSIKTR
jgi:hypothetical protein